MPVYVNEGATDTESPFFLWNNYLAGNVTWSGYGAELDGMERANMAAPDTFSFWKAGANAGNFTYAVAEFSAGRTIAACAIAGHNLASLNDMGGATLRFYTKAAVTDTQWMLLCDEVVIEGPEPVAVLFEPRDGVKLIRIQVGNTAGLPIIANWFAGKRFVVPAPVVGSYVQSLHAAQWEVDASVSLGGQFLGGVARKVPGDRDISFAPVPRQWSAYDTSRDFADHFNRGGTFFWGADPTGLPNDISYSWRAAGGDGWRPSARAGALADIAIKVASHA